MIYLYKEELLCLLHLEKGSMSDHMSDCDCFVLKETIQDMHVF